MWERSLLPVADDLPVQMARSVGTDYVQSAVFELLLHCINDVQPYKHRVHESDDVCNDEKTHPHIGTQLVFPINAPEERDLADR